jgi:hypothetical protein
MACFWYSDTAMWMTQTVKALLKKKRSHWSWLAFDIQIQPCKWHRQPFSICFCWFLPPTERPRRQSPESLKSGAMHGLLIDEAAVITVPVSILFCTAVCEVRRRICRSLQPLPPNGSVDGIAPRTPARRVFPAAATGCALCLRRYAFSNLYFVFNFQMRGRRYRFCLPETP